jgi:hypothetical protein
MSFSAINSASKTVTGVRYLSTSQLTDQETVLHALSAPGVGTHHEY